jgi:dodecin
MSTKERMNTTHAVGGLSPDEINVKSTKENIMAKVVKVIELLAQSEKSWEDAAQGAVQEASKTLRNIRSIYIKEFEAAVESGKITQYRVNAKVTFDLETDRT